MALRFYTGSSGAGKTTALLQEMIRQSLEEPARRFFVIVPEQATMDMQKRLVSLHPRRCILNLEVTSLNRLAYRVFDETGARNEELLEEIGKTFLIDKIALEQKKNLPYLGASLTKPEYLAEMKSLLSEMMLYDVSPETLEQMLQNTEVNSRFKAKMADVITVYYAFREKLAGTYMTAEEVPDRFCRAAGKSKLLAGSVIAMDGFTGFTPVQLRLLETILPMVRDLYVTLTIDPDRGITGKWKKTELFALSRETADALRHVAYNAGVKVEEPIVSERSEKSRLAGSKELSFLEQHLFRPGKTDAYAGAHQDLVFSTAGSPRAETEACAREICRLIREEGLRYRDIAVVTGDLASYGIYAAEAFASAQIPYFIDEKRFLIRNPFIEYLRAALETCTDGYSFESMFRMLKSGIPDFTREEIDHLENYALGTGLRGKGKWRETFIHSYRNEDPGEVPKLELVRRRVMELIDPLSIALAKRGGTVREKAAAIYDFCLRSGAEQKLRAAEQRYRELGKNDLAREYAQVYPYVVSFLDKLVATLGDETISMTDFRSLLEAGFAEAKIAIIPPGNDRVIIGDVERTRISDVKVLFFLGVNEGLVPKVKEAGGLLTESDREQLLGSNISLKPTVRQTIYIERFYLYTVLTKPSQRLYLSYSRTTGKGDPSNPSYILDTVCRLMGSPDYREDLNEFAVERKTDGLRILTEEIQRITDQPISPEAKELFLSYRFDPEYADYTERLLEAASMRKPVDRISEAAAKALYGTTLYSSATRLEDFCACAFRQFLKHGLRLKERPDYLFTGMDLGNIIHRSLELLGTELKGKRFDGYSEETLKKMADQALKSAVHEVGEASVLNSTARDQYRIQKMQRLMDASVKTISEQMRVSDFSIYAAEEDFRSREGLKSLEFEFPDGTKMMLSGRIDRIDTYESGDATYVKIVDYKTGGTTYDPALIYYGLQLQLVMYMNAAMEILRKEGKNPQPAGMFYFRIQDPVLDYAEDEDPTELMTRRLKKTMGSGVVSAEDEALDALDRTLRSTGKSNVIPVSFTQKGGMAKTSKVLDGEGFHVLGNYVNYKIRKAGAEILQGSAEMNPYAIGNMSACEYCPFAEVCGFEPKIPGCKFRMLDKMKPEVALALMVQAMTTGEEDDT